VYHLHQASQPTHTAGPFIPTFHMQTGPETTGSLDNPFSKFKFDFAKLHRYSYIRSEHPEADSVARGATIHPTGGAVSQTLQSTVEEQRTPRVKSEERDVFSHWREVQKGRFQGGGVVACGIRQ